MWLSVLFSMMCLAEQFCLVAGDEPPAQTATHDPEMPTKSFPMSGLGKLYEANQLCSGSTYLIPHNRAN
jgi:hypothetical protein